MKVAKSTAFAVVVVILVAALAVGAWQLGWFVKEKNVNRQTGINNRSVARQTALQQQMIDNYRDVRDIEVQITEADESVKPRLEAQKKAIVTQFCDAYYQTTDSAVIPDNIYVFATQECA